MEVKSDKLKTKKTSLCQQCFAVTTKILHRVVNRSQPLPGFPLGLGSTPRTSLPWRPLHGIKNCTALKTPPALEDSCRTEPPAPNLRLLCAFPRISRDHKGPHRQQECPRLLAFRVSSWGRCSTESGTAPAPSPALSSLCGTGPPTPSLHPGHGCPRKLRRHEHLRRH